jgi:PAS domain S-box-containing protein
VNNVALILADISGQIHFWSAGAVALFGHSAAEAVGKRVDLIVPPQYRDEHWAGFDAAMKSGIAKYDGQVMDLPVLCKDGNVIEFSAQLMFLRDARRAVIGALGIFETKVAD